MSSGPGLRGLAARHGTLVRFAIIGVAATLSYLAVSLILLQRQMAPQLVNVAAFGISLAVSYAGHYFFTFRSDAPHTTTLSRFVVFTVILLGICSGLQHLALQAGVSAKASAFLIAATYPPMSYLTNRLLTFSER